MKLNLKYNHKQKRVLTHCFICLSTKDLQQHRINPGVAYTADNVIGVCRTHHNWLHYLLKFNKLREYEIAIRGAVIRNNELVKEGLFPYW